MKLDYETANFYMVVEERKEVGTNVPTSCYRIRNKKTEVPEYEDYILYRAIITMLEMQVLLDDTIAKYNETLGPKVLSLVGETNDKPVH